MEGSILRFYVHENDRVHHRLAWEWLLEQANSLGLRGGSAFRAMAGFGRRHVLHEERFSSSRHADHRGRVHRD